MNITRDRTGALEINGRSWDADGTVSARCWSEAPIQRRLDQWKASLDA